jgi:hypothetical protein
MTHGRAEEQAGMEDETATSRFADDEAAIRALEAA